MQDETKLFRELPLGTRFKYPGFEQVWVILEHQNRGLVARWEGANAEADMQMIRAAAENETECEALLVEVVG